MAGNEKGIPGDLLEKYLSGQCSGEELRLIDEWYQSFENDEDGLSGLNDLERKVLGERLLNRMHRRIQDARKPHGREKKLYPTLLKIAASLVLVASLAYSVKFYMSERKAPVAAIQDASVAVSNTSENLEKHILPDGSLIWLYPKSEIRYSREFVRATRELHLSGEAFFDVARDTLRPFLIYSGEVTTKVLGTSFTIRAYEGDSTVQVHVLSGKVSVVGKGEVRGQVVLLPNESAIVSRAEKTLARHPDAKKPKEQEIWSNVSLSFKDAPVGEVLDLLSRRYDVHFDLSDEDIRNCTITANFTDQNLPTMIEIIGKTIMAAYTISDDTISLSGDGCDAIR